MTIHAQLPPPSAGSAEADRPTAQMPVHGPISPDGFARLDHRTRSRTVALGEAPPGRYLSIEHREEVRLIPLHRPIIHIGRGLASDVRLEDPRVSRRHAIIAQRAGATRVLDDRSSAGTFLNGRSVTAAALTDGDVLRLGSVVLRFVEITPQIEPGPVLRRIPLPVRARGGLVTGSAA